MRESRYEFAEEWRWVKDTSASSFAVADPESMDLAAMAIASPR